jgi:hypothetical protein
MIMIHQIVSPGLDMVLLGGLMACSAMSMVYTMPPSQVHRDGRYPANFPQVGMGDTLKLKMVIPIIVCRNGRHQDM